MGEVKVQKTLKTEKPLIFVDNRELNSKVYEYLNRHDAIIKTKNLNVADYICSERVAVEKKTVKDFIASLFDQRIFHQLKNLSESYERPILFIEGNPELLFAESNTNPNVIRGALASIAVDSKIPIIWTQNARETAAFLYWIAYREQVKEKIRLSIRSAKKPKNLDEHQEYLVAGLPNINSKLSRTLLKHFKTPKKLFSASVEELKKVDGIGDKKAEKIYELVNKKYKPKVRVLA